VAVPLAGNLAHVDEGDREGRQPARRPNRVGTVPKRVLRRGPGCHIVSGIDRHLNEDGSRVSATEDGLQVFLGQEVGQRTDPLVAESAIIVPRQLEPNQPRLDHLQLIVVPEIMRSFAVSSFSPETE